MFFRLDIFLAVLEWLLGLGPYQFAMAPFGSSRSRPPHAYATPRVRLPQGTYEGRVMLAEEGATQTDPKTETKATTQNQPKDLEAFLGVPYAQSTAGDNRFRAPQALVLESKGSSKQSTTVYQAKQFGAYCPGTGFVGTIPFGEDCLNANIFRPLAVNKTQKLPVVVYVHGGGFNNGLGAERNMSDFVRYSEADLVGVSFNYRVGALGFLGWYPEFNGSASSSKAKAEDAPLNVGLRDQQMLFAWVQANIGQFGGDPDNVTIMGLSAGAHSRAILESGAATARAVLNKDHPRPQAQLRRFLQLCSIPVDAPDVPDRLRRLPLGILLKAGRAVWDDYVGSVCWPFQPVVDGDILKKVPLVSWKDFQSHIPVLTGFDANEGTMFVPSNRERADTDEHFRRFFQTLIPGFKRDDMAALKKLYLDPIVHKQKSPFFRDPLPPGVTGRQWARLEAAYAHYAYICPVLQTATLLANKTTSAPVYVYAFEALNGARSTSNHGDNAPVVAHDMNNLADHPGLLAVSHAMHGAWERFVVSGDPNPPDTDTPWLPFSSIDTSSIRVFGQGNNERVPLWARPTDHPDAEPGVPASNRTLTAFEKEQCRFWWDRAELSEGYGRREGVASSSHL